MAENVTESHVDEEMGDSEDIRIDAAEEDSEAESSEMSDGDEEAVEAELSQLCDSLLQKVSDWKRFTGGCRVGNRPTQLHQINPKIMVNM